ncbi:hypothetical protein BS47DRAFT_868555 [Hydnum rufescens UP504]|uniref:Uncharacterized protein n=1 Tax=Hydnum rufescens UP504 TaxID=1448309 RepID=A0A9P6B143_9AGAM|nr:hypothetical protein BS47DRAFT_868555 [Hydnum rufescens UP504]
MNNISAGQPSQSRETTIFQSIWRGINQEQEDKSNGRITCARRSVVCLRVRRVSQGRNAFGNALNNDRTLSRTSGELFAIFCSRNRQCLVFVHKTKADPDSLLQHFLSTRSLLWSLFSRFLSLIALHKGVGSHRRCVVQPSNPQIIACLLSPLRLPSLPVSPWTSSPFSSPSPLQTPSLHGPPLILSRIPSHWMIILLISIVVSPRILIT